MICAFRHRCQRGDVDALETNTGVNAPEINALESNTLTDGIVCHNEGGPCLPCGPRLPQRSASDRTR
jgi:hypothetical protein